MRAKLACKRTSQKLSSEAPSAAGAVQRRKVHYHNELKSPSSPRWYFDRIAVRLEALELQCAALTVDNAVLMPDVG